MTVFLCSRDVSGWLVFTEACSRKISHHRRTQGEVKSLQMVKVGFCFAGERERETKNVYCQTIYGVSGVVPSSRESLSSLSTGFPVGEQELVGEAGAGQQCFRPLLKI